MTWLESSPQVSAPARLWAMAGKGRISALYRIDADGQTTRGGSLLSLEISSLQTETCDFSRMRLFRVCLRLATDCNGSYLTIDRATSVSTLPFREFGRPHALLRVAAKQHCVADLPPGHSWLMFTFLLFQPEVEKANLMRGTALFQGWIVAESQE